MIALALALALGAAPPAAPGASSLAGASRGAPVKVDADEVHYRFARRQVEFKGDPVRLTRDDAVLTCRRLVAQNDEAGAIRTATCDGDVRFVRGERTVTCTTAIFDNAASRVTCEGSPVLRDGGTVARGDRLTYDLASDEVKLERPVVVIPGEQLETPRRALEARRKEARR